MKKQITLILALAALASVPATAQVSIQGDETNYASVSDALVAAKSGATILVNESYTETAQILPAEKTVTVKGADGVTISYNGIYLFNMQNVAGEMTIENLTLKNIGTAVTARNTVAVGRGSLIMNNVTIDGAWCDNPIISLDNTNSNIPNAVLNNVKLINCTCGADAQVLVNNCNTTLAGDTQLSLKLASTNYIKDASAFTGIVDLVLDTHAVGGTVVKNCTNPALFNLVDKDGYVLQVSGSGLILAEKPTTPVVNANTNVGYENLSAAVAAASSGNVLVLNKDITLTGSVSVGGKTITVKGATGAEKIIRGTGNKKFFFLVNTAGDDLTIEDLTLDGNNVECDAAMLQTSVDGGNLNIRNVQIINCKTTNARGLIDNYGVDKGAWHLDGVTFADCDVPNQLVTAHNNGNTISGDNSLSLRINADYTVDATGCTNSTPISVTMGTVTSGKLVITNCPADNLFTCANTGYHFEYDAHSGNIGMWQDGVSGIADIPVDDTDAQVIWYNLQGEIVTPDTPGLYIKVVGPSACKVYIK